MELLVQRRPQDHQHQPLPPGPMQMQHQHLPTQCQLTLSPPPAGNTAPALFNAGPTPAPAPHPGYSNDFDIISSGLPCVPADAATIAPHQCGVSGGRSYIAMLGALC